MGEIRWGPRDAVVPCIDLNDGSMHYAIESFPNFNIRAADWPKINCPAMLQHMIWRHLIGLHHRENSLFDTGLKFGSLFDTGQLFLPYLTPS
jgi:hypothetical protein